MGIGSVGRESIYSLKQALDITALRKSMNQDVQTVSSLLQGMQNTSAKIMESSVTPHKGGNIDLRV